VGAGKTGHIADKKPCRAIPFNDCLEIGFHGEEYTMFRQQRSSTGKRSSKRSFK
jgi:hypothetical protein